MPLNWLFDAYCDDVIVMTSALWISIKLLIVILELLIVITFFLFFLPSTLVSKFQ